MSGGSKVTYYIGQYTPGYGHQNLKDIKTYPTPTGGTVRTVGGQKILVASSNVKTANLSSRMPDITDEINITAKLAGLPSPLITSATDGTHSPGSIHGTGHALDLHRSEERRVRKECVRTCRSC